MKVVTNTRTELMANIAGNPNWDYDVRSVAAALLALYEFSAAGAAAVDKYLGELGALGVGFSAEAALVLARIPNSTPETRAAIARNARPG